MIYVVGCNHGIQPSDPDPVFGDAAEAADQKAHFACLIERIITGSGIEFIGEEWGLTRPSVSQNLANRHEKAWANINTSLDDLDHMGIPQDYVHGPYSQAEKDRWNRQREEFMLERIEENRKSAQNILVVCGFIHLVPLGESVKRISNGVRLVDYRELDWYRPGVFCDDD